MSGTRFLWLALLVSLFACSRNDGEAGRSGVPLIAVSIPPQAWFVDRIAGDKARVLVLAGPGQNPHNYDPNPRQIRDLANAGAWILSGAEFEFVLKPKIASLFPDLMIVDGTDGVNFRSLEEYDLPSVSLSHDSLRLSGETLHSVDRHTWLGHEPAKILALHIEEAMSLLDPENAQYYSGRCQALLQEIDGEFARLKTELAPLAGSSVFVYHPSFGYFLDEFDIRQEAVETGGKEPGPRELNRLIEKAREEHVTVIFVQAQFPVNAAKTVATAVGAQVTALDPLAGDWIENIRAMGQALKTAAGIK